ncbi:MAG: hypothetical protein Q4P34_00355 [Tissierellia bacterium]|nr:hypothetical protein [Tissierellia bacterium]
MRILEYGKENKNRILMVQGSCMNIDLWDKTLDILKEKYHIILPVIPGHDYESSEEFTDCEDISKRLERDLLNLGYDSFEAAYGFSMGGSLLIKIMDYGNLRFKRVLLDGGITPYDIPKVLTRLISFRDFLKGKLFTANKKLMMKMLSHYDYPMESAEKFYRAFSSMTNKSMYNVFYSCNNYSIDLPIKFDGKIVYWYGDRERKARQKDIKNCRIYFPQIEFEEFEGMDHGQFVSLNPQAFSKKFDEFMETN